MLVLVLVSLSVTVSKFKIYFSHFSAFALQGLFCQTAVGIKRSFQFLFEFIFIWIIFYLNSFSFFLSSSILLFLASSFLSNEPKSHRSCNGSIWLFWLIEWLWDYFSIQSTFGRRWNKMKVFKDAVKFDCIIFIIYYIKMKVCMCVCVCVCPAACCRTYTTNHPEIWHGLLISPWLCTKPGGNRKCWPLGVPPIVTPSEKPWRVKNWVGASKQKLLLGVGLPCKILFVGAHPNLGPAGSTLPNGGVCCENWPGATKQKLLIIWFIDLHWDF